MNEKEKNYYCGNYKLTFKSRQAKSRHVNNSCGRSKHIYICETCGKESNRKDNHERHLKSCSIKKAQREEFICHICFKEFHKKCNLQRHMKTHSKMEHLCQNCNKRYIRIDHFIAHKEQCQKKDVVSDHVDVDHVEYDEINEIVHPTISIELDQNYSLADLSMAFDSDFNEVIIYIYARLFQNFDLIVHIMIQFCKYLKP